MIRNALIALFLSILLLPSESIAQTFEKVLIDISGLRSDAGIIGVAVYVDNESFQNDKPFLEKQDSNYKVKDGKCTVEMELSSNKYGFAMLHDENSNGEMDYNWIGYPLEGFGFSEYWHSGLFRPSVDKFTVVIGDDEKERVSIRDKYM